MNSDDTIRIMHMLDAAQEAISFFKGVEKSQLIDNRMLLLATVKELEIVGEAAAKISLETKEDLPEIPWADIIGMRHRLAHAYFEIDTEVVWQTLVGDLPPLIALLETALKKSTPPNKTSK